MTTAVMLDIETLGTEPGVAVAQVGAVCFDNETGEIGEAFVKTLKIKPQLAAGLISDPSTEAWWKEQDKAVREVVFSSELHPVEFCKAFRSWWPIDVTRVYAQGASFDFGILPFMMRKFGSQEPWPFWIERDTRTVYDELGFNEKNFSHLNPKPHHGEFDCRHQIHMVMAARGKKDAKYFQE